MTFTGSLTDSFPLNDEDQTEINLRFKDEKCVDNFIKSMSTTCEEFNNILRANNAGPYIVQPKYRLNATDQASDKITRTLEIGLAPTVAWN